MKLDIAIESGTSSMRLTAETEAEAVLLDTLLTGSGSTAKPVEHVTGKASFAARRQGKMLVLVTSSWEPDSVV